MLYIDKMDLANVYIHVRDVMYILPWVLVKAYENHAYGSHMP